MRLWSSLAVNGISRRELLSEGTSRFVPGVILSRSHLPMGWRHVVDFVSGARRFSGIKMHPRKASAIGGALFSILSFIQGS